MGGLRDRCRACRLLGIPGDGRRLLGRYGRVRAREPVIIRVVVGVTDLNQSGNGSVILDWHRQGKHGGCQFIIGGCSISGVGSAADGKKITTIILTRTIY